MLQLPNATLNAAISSSLSRAQIRSVGASLRQTALEERELSGSGSSFVVEFA